MLFRFAKQFFKKSAQSCLTVENSPSGKAAHWKSRRQIRSMVHGIESKAVKFMTEAQKTKKFGIDASRHELIVGAWRLPLPQSRTLRITLGAALLFGGILGFLPVLGFWMVPLGLIVLSHDLAFVRRQRRKLSVWWARKRQTP